MRNLILAAIVFALVMAHPAYAADNLTIGDIREKYKSSVDNYDSISENNAKYLSQEMERRKEFVDNAQAMIQTVIDMKKNLPVAESSSNQRKEDMIIWSEEQSHSESQTQPLGLYEDWNATYNQKVKERIIGILSEIPLQGKLSPSESGLKTAIEILRENGRSGIHLTEIQGINERLIAMQKEMNDIERKFNRATIRQAPGLQAILTIVSFAGIYFVKRRQKKVA